MRNILEEIIKYKKEFVKNCKKSFPLNEMETKAQYGRTPKNFINSLKSKKCALIAEIKTASPSKGIIRPDMDIAEIAKIYEENGASCISVLTDEKYFMGNIERLSTLSRTCGLPLLRKDFIIDVYQIFEARAAGADAVLLIAACLDDYQLADFMEISALIGMEYLLEVHNEIELERVKNLNIKLLGVNNRNLTNFETDISTTGKISGLIPSGVTLVSESGIENAGDVRSVNSMGADAVLVGEALMRASDIGQKVRELSNAV